MSDLKPAIIWCDIETTGLDDLNDFILEIGLRVTDWWGSEISRFTSLVWNPFWRNRLAENSYIQVMHEDSGLFAELVRLEEDLGRVRAEHIHGLAAVQLKALDFLGPFVGLGPYDGMFPLSGSSIQFDRAFMDVDMHSLNRWFHYRNHDVSALREECRLSNSVLHGKEPELPKKHRPQGDIDNSIALRQHYLKNFLWVGEERFIPED